MNQQRYVCATCGKKTDTNIEVRTKCCKQTILVCIECYIKLRDGVRTSCDNCIAKKYNNEYYKKHFELMVKRDMLYINLEGQIDFKNKLSYAVTKEAPRATDPKS